MLCIPKYSVIHPPHRLGCMKTCLLSSKVSSSLQTPRASPHFQAPPVTRPSCVALSVGIDDNRLAVSIRFATKHVPLHRSFHLADRVGVACERHDRRISSALPEIETSSNDVSQVRTRPLDWPVGQSCRDPRGAPAAHGARAQRTPTLEMNVPGVNGPRAALRSVVAVSMKAPPRITRAVAGMRFAQSTHALLGGLGPA